MSLMQSKAIHAAGGFCLMGCWAAFANRGHEMPAPFVAGVVQGVLAAMITLLLKRVIETIYHRVAGWRRSPGLIAALKASR